MPFLEPPPDITWQSSTEKIVLPGRFLVRTSKNQKTSSVGKPERPSNDFAQ
ncbi:hypothetical protein FM101_09735 [Arthrobacter rhombi]|uniref:Uncharacterized protein n=1 Tax=Arthrobacter rhombi TaxID=71253 RepID=A0A1R4GDF1_9MICC|nr:hypothetical protein FM101_09735 [Arthrobacter rhombi]